MPDLYIYIGGFVLLIALFVRYRAGKNKYDYFNH